MAKERVAIRYDEDSGLYDIAIDPLTGDLTVDSTYYTDILVSLFTDKRADIS